MEKQLKPLATVDIIIELNSQIVLIDRKNPPFGWAIPGGFVDYGETVEQAALREAKEETCLDIQLVRLLGVYSNPKRDPRCHTVSTVFVAKADGKPKAADDAKAIGLFVESTLPGMMAFDHANVLSDYFRSKKSL
jgi:ADP-ribose pyrophosphatase YjhB (NUDIX family)